MARPLGRKRAASDGPGALRLNVLSVREAARAAFGAGNTPLAVAISWPVALPVSLAQHARGLAVARVQAEVAPEERAFVFAEVMSERLQNILDLGAAGRSELHTLGTALGFTATCGPEGSREQQQTVDLARAVCSALQVVAAAPTEDPQQSIIATVRWLQSLRGRGAWPKVARHLQSSTWWKDRLGAFWLGAAAEMSSRPVRSATMAGLHGDALGAAELAIRDLERLGVAGSGTASSGSFVAEAKAALEENLRRQVVAISDEVGALGQSPEEQSRALLRILRRAIGVLGSAAAQLHDDVAAELRARESYVCVAAATLACESLATVLRSNSQLPEEQFAAASEEAQRAVDRVRAEAAACRSIAAKATWAAVPRLRSGLAAVLELSTQATPTPKLLSLAASGAEAAFDMLDLLPQSTPDTGWVQAGRRTAQIAREGLALEACAQMLTPRSTPAQPSESAGFAALVSPGATVGTSGPFEGSAAALGAPLGIACVDVPKALATRALHRWFALLASVSDCQAAESAIRRFEPAASVVNGYVHKELLLKLEALAHSVSVLGTFFESQGVAAWKAGIPDSWPWGKVRVHGQGMLRQWSTASVAASVAFADLQKTRKDTEAEYTVAVHAGVWSMMARDAEKLLLSASVLFGKMQVLVTEVRLLEGIAVAEGADTAKGRLAIERQVAAMRRSGVPPGSLQPALWAAAQAILQASPTDGDMPLATLRHCYDRGRASAGTTSPAPRGMVAFAGGTQQCVGSVRCRYKSIPEH